MSGFFGASDSGASTRAPSGRKSIVGAGSDASEYSGGVVPEERERVGAIQRQLAQETLFRSRGFGLRSLLGGARTSLLGMG